MARGNTRDKAQAKNIKKNAKKGKGKLADSDKR